MPKGKNDFLSKATLVCTRYSSEFHEYKSSHPGKILIHITPANSHTYFNLPLVTVGEAIVHTYNWEAILNNRWLNGKIVDRAAFLLGYERQVEYEAKIDRELAEELKKKPGVAA
ncbi:MAG: hypothetical protein KAW12_07090 [Candidatus Aminicenantes bacterium]|nr:hypothetical protein [Candidatus Aminicenantes bacterium]